MLWKPTRARPTSALIFPLFFLPDYCCMLCWAGGGRILPPPLSWCPSSPAKACRDCVVKLAKIVPDSRIAEFSTVPHAAFVAILKHGRSTAQHSRPQVHSPLHSLRSRSAVRRSGASQSGPQEEWHTVSVASAWRGLHCHGLRWRRGDGHR